MTKELFLLFVFFILFSLYVDSQENSETETHVFWQKDRPLTQRDFEGDGTTYNKSMFLCDSLNMCYMASLGVYEVLDIPKRKKDRGRLLEKAYFVPIFEKATSYILKDNDSMGIEKQQIVFDIYELSARYARKQLKEYQEKMGDSYGVLSIMFATVKDDAKKFRDKLVNAHTQDNYVHKKDSAYYKWRSFIDEGLEMSKEYATAVEDCQRAYTQKPLDKEYIFQNTIIGNLFEGEEIK